VRIAHHREVTHNSANIDRRFNQNVLLAREFGDSIDFLARVALKAEMIEAGLNLLLNDHENEQRVFVGSGRRTKPNIVSTFEPSIANDRQAADRSVEID